MKNIGEGLSNDVYAMFLCCLSQIFFIKAYVMGTHLNSNGYPQHMPLYRSRQKLHWL